MRTDEAGEPCPATLGEYRDLCAELFPNSEAVAYLDREIRKSPTGRARVVKIPDRAMRAILVPRGLVEAGKFPVYECACGEEIVAVAGARAAEPGDLMFCNHCGEVGRYGLDGTLARAPFETLDTATQAVVRQARSTLDARRAG
jgi:hypothetical protein